MRFWALSVHLQGTEKLHKKRLQQITKAMKTVTLKRDDSIHEKFTWRLEHFSGSGITILEQAEYLSDDDYLRSIDGMAQSLQEAQQEPLKYGVTLEKLEW